MKRIYLKAFLCQPHDKTPLQTTVQHSVVSEVVICHWGYFMHFPLNDRMMIIIIWFAMVGGSCLQTQFWEMKQFTRKRKKLSYFNLKNSATVGYRDCWRKKLQLGIISYAEEVHYLFENLLIYSIVNPTLQILGLHCCKLSALTYLLLLLLPLHSLTAQHPKKERRKKNVAVYIQFSLLLLVVLLMPQLKQPKKERAWVSRRRRSLLG